MRVVLVHRLLLDTARGAGRSNRSGQVPGVQDLAYLNWLKYLKLYSYQIETDVGPLKRWGNDLQETGTIWAIDGRWVGARARHSNCTCCI
jgi:hypothetical protein